RHEGPSPVRRRCGDCGKRRAPVRGVCARGRSAWRKGRKRKTPPGAGGACKPMRHSNWRNLSLILLKSAEVFRADLSKKDAANLNQKPRGAHRGAFVLVARLE